MMKIIRILLFVAGLLVLHSVLDRIGYTTMFSELSRIGWWSVPITLCGLLWHWYQSRAWQRILRHQRHVPMEALYRFRVAGESVNAVTPANFVGGDPVRIYLLRRFLPWTTGTMSVVIDRTLQSIATMVIILCGALLAFWWLPHMPANVQVGLPIVLVVAGGFVIYIFLHQQRGLFSFGISLAKRLRIRRHFAPTTVTKCAELDALIATFYRDHPRDFWCALFYHWIGRILGILELYFIGHPLNHHFGWGEALLLGALAPIINILFSFIPGAVGVMEGAFSASLYLLKLPPSLGLTIQIVKRLRATLWLVAGFLVLSAHDRRKLTNAHATVATLTHDDGAYEKNGSGKD